MGKVKEYSPKYFTLPTTKLGLIRFLIGYKSKLKERKGEIGINREKRAR